MSGGPSPARSRFPRGNIGSNRRSSRGARYIASLTVREEEGGAPLDARAVARFIEIDEARGVDLPLSGPTVARIQARTDAGQVRELSAQIDEAPAAKWMLDGTEDRSARRALAVETRRWDRQSSTA